MTTNGATFLNIEYAAEIIAQLRRHNRQEKSATGEYAVVISEPIDSSTPSPDDDTTAHDLDYEEANDGAA